MKNFNYSWRQIAKASFIGIATTATFYLTKTTGLFSSWFSTEEISDSLSESKETDIARINIGQRRLLQQGGVTVANPIPDQVIQVGIQYQYSLNNVFSGNYTLLLAEQVNQQPLPAWLSMQYKQLGAVVGGALGVAVSGTTVFVAEGADGLQIVDVSNASAPRRISTVARAGGYANGVAVSGTTAFVADSSAGLQIVDVSDVSKPRIVSTVAGAAFNVAVSGNMVFMAGGFLQIVDVSDISNPHIISTIPNSAGGSANDVAVSGALVFVADGDAGLQIVDVSDISNPHIVSTVPNSVGGIALGIAVSGNTAFIADDVSLQIVDVSDVSRPRIVSTMASSTGNRIFGVAVSGAAVFVVADGDAGLQIIDVSDTSNPWIVSTVANSAGGRASGVAVSGSMVFVADGAAGLQIVDTSQASLIGVPPFTQSLMLSISAWDVTKITLSTSFMLICDQFPQLSVTALQDQSLFPGASLHLPLQTQLLFTNPRNAFLRLTAVLTNGLRTPGWLEIRLMPLTVSTLPNGAGGFAYGVAVNGTTAFVADYSAGLQIVDVSNAGNPRILSTVPNNAGGGASGVAVSGTTVFVADYSAGLQIVDISNVSNPRIISTVANNAGGTAFNIAVSGATVFVADADAGLQIVDVSNTSNPRIVSTVANSAGGFASGIAVSGVTVFVADYYVLQIVDISNISNPRIISTVANSAGGVAVSGTTVFVADGTAGLQIVDISNISNPRIISTVPNNAGGVASGVAVSGTTVFVVDDTAGLQIIDVNNINNPRMLSTVANSAGGAARGVAVSGNTVFVADGNAGLQIIDISQWQLIATPSAADVGNYRMQLVATDDLGGSAATQPFTIRVEGPPQFHGNISTQFAKVGQTFNYFIPQGLVTDPNFDAMVFTAMLISGQSLPAWLSFNGISATFAGTPPSSAVGNVTILLSVTDNIAGSVNTTFLLQVSHAPVVNQRIADQAMGIGRNNSFLLPPGTFTHADNLPLVYSARRSNGLSLPTWLGFNGISGIFTGQPNITDAGAISVLVTADDQAGGQASTPFTLMVENFPRVNQLIGSQSAGVNVPYRFSIANSFVDDDGDTMTFQAIKTDGSVLPSWLSFNAFGLEFSGTPSASDLESFLVRLSATDSLGGRTDQVFNISVVYFPVVGTPIYPQVSCVAQSYQFTVPSNTFLAGGSGFTYLARQSNNQPLPTWLTLDGVSGSFSGTPATTDVDQITVTLTGTATSGGTVSTDFSLTTTTCPSLRNPILSRITNVNTPFALTVAGDTFDNGGMTLALSAERMDHSAPPNWLSFNPVSGVLAGVPLASDVKMESLQIVARNPLGGQAVAPFNLTVCYFPTLTAALPVQSPLRAQRAFSLIVPSGTFTSQTGTPLQYQAQQADGAALPSWLAFNATQQILFGTPGLTDLGNFNLHIIASDPTCGSTPAPLQLVVQQNYPPEVVHPLTNQVASVGARFTFFAPSDTFTDRNDDSLTYTAAQSSGQSLPGWLHFTANTLSFSGTPERGDTDAFSDKVLTIALTAHDDKSQTSANFNINVQGTSNVLLFIKIAAPIFSVLTTALALYSQRGRILNHCKPQRYQRLEDYTVTVGEPFEYKFATPSEEIIKVRARIAKENKGCCRLFQVPRQALPGGTDLPLWMEYNPETNTLRTIGPVPKTKLTELFVQAKGSAERTLEQFTLRILQPELSQEVEATEQRNLSSEPDAPTSSGSGDVEMQTLHSTAPRVSF